MSFRRPSIAAVILLGSRLAIGQQAFTGPSLEEIPNWSSAPFWTSPNAIGLERAREASVLDPMAVEAVPTPPVPFTGINPCRIVDTRGNGFTGAYGPPALTQGIPRNFTLAGQCGISGAAQAVSLNITVTNTQGPGFILIYPQGGAQPGVSTLNYVAGQTIANAAVVPLGTAGGVTIIAGVSGADLIIDTNGYYAPQTVVNTVNGLSGTVALAQGTNISITPSGNTLTIATAPQTVVNTLNGLSGAVALAQGTNITITPSGNALTIASTGGGASGWSLTGNSGTTAGTNFLGTTDNQALEIQVNAKRVFRFEPSDFGPNLVGGYSGNAVLVSAYGATIAGGGSAGAENRVTDYFGSIGGGSGNRAGNSTGTFADAGWATVAGGGSNQAGAAGATVAGGISNLAIGSYSAIGGGASNYSANNASVGGGDHNSAAGDYASVPGGRSNTASGSYSFASGRRGKAVHDGAFVWGASTDADVASTGANQFIVRAPGGIWLGTTSAPSITIATDFLNTSTGAHLTIGGIWTNNSDRASKYRFEPVDRRELLVRVAQLPISEWSYKAEDGSVRHIGPMAQDFSAAFGLGSDDRSIATLDADGVALAAIQALYKLVTEKDRRIEALEERLSKLEASSLK
jgi:hypothetical protein